MAQSNWSAEDANDNYARNVEREQRREAARRQTRAGAAAGRWKRRI